CKTFIFQAEDGIRYFHVTGVQTCALPILIITHDHWDHLDYETVIRMKEKVGVVICGLGVGAHLERWGYSADMIIEKDWYETVERSEERRVGREEGAQCGRSREVTQRSYKW